MFTGTLPLFFLSFILMINFNINKAFVAEYLLLLLLVVVDLWPSAFLFLFLFEMS